MIRLDSPPTKTSSSWHLRPWFLLALLFLSLMPPTTRAFELSDIGHYDIPNENVDDKTNKNNDNLEVDDTVFEQFDPTYPLGTKVYRRGGDKGRWWVGTIESYDSEDGTYRVQWDDGRWNEYEEGPELDRLVANVQKVRPPNHDHRHKIGTRVFKLFSDGAQTGEIVAYEDGVYRIQWEDNSLEEYSEGSELDRMVEDKIHHRPTKYEIGTEVYKQFAQGDVMVWKIGIVVSCVDGVYRIHWEDDVFEEYTDGTEMDQMVKDDWIIPTYDIGTSVYELSDDNGSWVEGNIVSYDDGIYRVRWTDNTFSEYKDGSDLARIVDNAKDLPGYPMGTEVQKKVGSHWKIGNIVNSKDELYTIRWVDNSYEDIPTGPEFDAMVNDAIILSSASNAKDASNSGRVVRSISTSLIPWTAMALCLALFGGFRIQSRRNCQFVAIAMPIDEYSIDKQSTGAEIEVV